MRWGWIFAQVIGDERSTKVAKIIVVHWCLTFLLRGQVRFPMHLYVHHTFVWENCWEFEMTSPLKPLGQCCSNFMWSLLRLGERKIAKMVPVHWPRWPPCPYMVKIFKNLLLQKRRCLGAESLHKSSGMGDLPKLLKWWAYIDVWPFYSEVKFASLCICMGTIHLYGKTWEFETSSPLKPLGQCCSNFIGSLLRLWKRKIAKMVTGQCPTPLTKMAAMPIYGKNR